MEVTYATKAIVLKIEPWNEVDSKVSFYTQEKGKLELIARGTRKLTSKLVSHLQPFNLVDLMVINGKRVGYAGAAISLACYSQIKQDLDKVQIANQFINIVNRLIKTNEPDPEIFSLIRQFLNILEQVESEVLFYDFLAQASLLQLLCLLGYAPDIDLANQRLNFLNRTPTWQKLSISCLGSLQLIINHDLLTALSQLKLDRQVLQEINKTVQRLVILTIEK